MKPAALVWLTALSSLAASPKLDFALGILAQQRGDGKAAAEAIEKARAADPVAFPLVRRVAEQRRLDGDLEGASTLYREFAASQPQRLDGQLAYADFLREASPDDDFAAKMARETLEKSLERFPDASSVRQRLFRTYESLGQRDRSLALFEALASSSPGPSEALEAASMARTLFPKDDLTARARVDELLRGACARMPQDPGLARTVSEHFRTTGRLPEAVEIMAKHVEAAPSSLRMRTQLGILQLMAGMQKEAEATLLEVVAIDANEGRAHLTLGNLYRKQDRAAEAREHAAQALKVRGGGASDFTELADEFLAAEQAREARLLLEKAMFYHPDDADVAVKLAVATRRDPETRERSSRLFREAESLSGEKGPATDPVFLTEFAECLLESGQTKAAEDRLRAAIRTYPPEQKKDLATALRRLAGIWQAEKRNEEAAKALLQRADGLDPR